MARFLPLAAAAFVGVLAGVSASRASAQDKPAGTDLATFSAHAMTKMMAADTDHDGRISKAEFEAAAQARGARHAGGRMFDHADTNHDGTLDQSEIQAMLAKRFARMDANHDGVLTPDERHPGRGAADSQG